MSIVIDTLVCKGRDKIQTSVYFLTELEEKLLKLVDFERNSTIVMIRNTIRLETILQC